MDFLPLSTSKSCTTPFTEPGVINKDCAMSNIKESKSISDKDEKFIKNVLQNQYAVQYTGGDSLINKYPETAPFPYPSTKLRAEAPPFMPEGIIISLENIPHVTLDMTPVSEECFFNINLPQDPINQMIEDNNGFKDIKERELQSFGPDLNEATENDSLKVNISIEKDMNEVAVEASPSTVVREEIATQYPSRPSIFLRRFTLESRTQIAVLVTSIVVSMVLIIYVFV
ncbi:uncharacterized protein [Chelonus insularis]|uniref:uncharacterized protein n=1 Tax=Chelonus insularis TaxID=460826 RepID=UPI00158D7C52|nr:uncharacterized protein LOC118070445 [Chelonus insularis]